MLKNGLCVPMLLDALVVNDYIRQNRPFRRHRMDYAMLDRWDSPEPLPFGDLEDDFRNNPDNNGIYLQWELPSGFTQVILSKDKSDIRYPLVPNRWLITRKLHGVDSSPYDASWIVVSDKLWRISSKGSPYRTFNEDFERFNSIGEKKRLEDWEELRFPADLFLTADGCGDFSFSAFQPGNENVFSIHDRLEGIPEDTEVDLNYTVLGWFSSSHEDPLHHVRSREQLLLILNRYQWKIDDSGQLPRRTLLKGNIEQVRWVRSGDPARTPRNNNPNHTVTIGMTSTDAICELMGSISGSNSQSFSQLLEVFLYGQLDALEEAGGEETIDDVIHKSGFRSSRGGIVWKLVDRKESPELRPSAAVAQTDDGFQLRHLLAQLNVLQLGLDETYRNVSTRQQQLYEAWWKWKKKCRRDGCAEAAELSRFIEILSHQLGQRTRQSEDVEKFVAIINDHLTQIGSTKQLTCEDMPRFWSPSDPVVLISGYHKQLNLPARPNINCVVYEFSENFTETSAGKLPEFVSEGLLLPIPDDTKQIWEQPWKPLFLEWEAEWTAIPYTSVNWQFDGRELRCADHPTMQPAQTFSGRTYLGAHSAFSIRDRLQHYVDHHPEPISIPLKLREFIAGMKEWDVLSQTLGGLHRQLLQHDPRMHPIPIGEEAEDMAILLENQSTAMPFAASISDRSPESLFQPIRSGHLKLKRLAIVDAFGQVEEIEMPLTPTFIAESLRTESDTPGIVELKPRIDQGARLQFHWVSSERDEDELNTSPEAQPICGWVLPNHLDRGLTLYDPYGKILGEVRLNGRVGSLGTTVWEPAPEVESLSDLAWRERNRHLERFIHGLTHAPDQGGALSALLPAIDETLWVINPKERSFDKSLSVIIGRPLVLARVKLSLELDGEDLFHPKYFPLFRHRPDYVKKKFKVKLGNLYSPKDGLIGYYLNDDYTKFYCVHKSNRANSPYLEEIGEASFFELPLTNRPIYATLLFDPSASIFSYTDVVPAKALNLPEKYYTQALQRMEVFFRVGPVLTTVLERTPDASRIIMPTPHLTSGEWTWFERSRTDENKWEPMIPVAEERKELPSREAPTIREGLLRLKLGETQP
ncbi:hypothetical protein [Paenibacillus maysiensis]|uniref:hypothetical protein n=1 Tax=Paenibacillus maysiensis TaxID=1155954 RepID=UPI000471BE8A|nr:hypothetical protein [Paenibacillus maysiensis]